MSISSRTISFSNSVSAGVSSNISARTWNHERDFILLISITESSALDADALLLNPFDRGRLVGEEMHLRIGFRDAIRRREQDNGLPPLQRILELAKAGHVGYGCQGANVASSKAPHNDGR